MDDRRKKIKDEFMAIKMQLIGKRRPSQLETNMNELHIKNMPTEIKRGEMLYKGAEQEIVKLDRFSYLTDNMNCGKYFAFPNENPTLDGSYYLNIFGVKETLTLSNWEAVTENCTEDEAFAYLEEHPEVDGVIFPVYVSESDLKLDHAAYEIILNSPQKILYIRTKKLSLIDFLKSIAG